MSAVEVKLAYMWWHQEKFVSSFNSKLIGLEQQLLRKASVAIMGVQCGSGDPGQMELRHLLPTDRFLLIILLSPSGDLGTGLVWDNPTTPPLFVKNVKTLFKLNQTNSDGFSVVLKMMSDVLWSSVDVLKSLWCSTDVSRWYQGALNCSQMFYRWMCSRYVPMILDVQRRFQMFTDVHGYVL